MAKPSAVSGLDRAGPTLARLLPDRFRLLEPPGAGADHLRAFATDGDTGARVFVKSAHADAVRREALALAAIDHPGVVRLLDWRLEDDAGVLVLAAIDGLDLEAFLAARGGRLDAPTTTRLLHDLADAVAAIHASGCLHRDLKPANILIRADQSPVIVDLGAASPLAGDPSDEVTSRLTEGYAAPEQYLSDQSEGPWTDVYGLASIGYRALVGHPPLAAPERLRGWQMLRAADAAEGAPKALTTAIDRGLVLETDRRPATITAWQAALPPLGPDPDQAASPEPTPRAPALAAADDYPPTVVVERVPTRTLAPPPAAAAAPAPRPQRRRLGALLWAAPVLAALVAVAAWQGLPLYQRHIKTEWLVDGAGGGDVPTIGEALARAGDGAWIRIAPGTYAESLHLDRPLHLVAANPDQPPAIAPAVGSCIQATAEGASISALVLRAPDTPEPTACVVVRAEVSVEDNQIVGSGAPALLVEAGAAPLIRANRIEGAGIVVTAGARPRISRQPAGRHCRAEPDRPRRRRARDHRQHHRGQRRRGLCRRLEGPLRGQSGDGRHRIGDRGDQWCCPRDRGQRHRGRRRRPGSSSTAGAKAGSRAIGSRRPVSRRWWSPKAAMSRWSATTSRPAASMVSW